MASEWTAVRAADFIEFNPRLSIKKGAMATKVAMDKLQPFTKKIPATEQAEFAGGSKFCNGDTIMARITPCLENGKTAYVDILADGEVAFGSTEFIVMRARAGISDPQFVYYLATSPAFRNVAIKSMVGSSGRQRVQQGVLDELELIVPPLEEQQKIGAMLAMFDQKIALNNKINDNLLRQAQLLFQSWFVDYQPFDGKRPDDWTEGVFADIVDFSNGYAFKSKELLDAPLPDCYKVFKQGHIFRGGGFNPDGTKSWYPRCKADGLKRYVLKKGDILMAMTDMKDNVQILGNTAIMEVDDQYIVNQRVGVLRCKKERGISYPYVFLLTNGKDFLLDLRSRANSGVQVNLSSTEIKNSPIYIAPRYVYDEFTSIVLPMFETMISNDIQNQQLAELRDTLLPKLISGEIDVSDIQL